MAGVSCLPAALQEELSLRPQAGAWRWLWHGLFASCPPCRERLHGLVSTEPGCARLKIWEEPPLLVAVL